jgi:hypothetical protein
MAAGPPSTMSIRRPCGVVSSAQGSLNDLNAVPAFVIASRVLLLLFICSRRSFGKHFSGGPRWPTPPQNHLPLAAQRCCANSAGI